MALPDNYNPWEHLQSVVLKTFNREVREEFSAILARWNGN